jgi:DNA-directed RNA polymerase specialized sigma24 family protein
VNAVEYLEQIGRLDRLINSRLAILSSLENSATRTTAVMEGEVVSHTRNVHALQDTIARIMDLRDEVNAITDEFVDLKTEAEAAIRLLDDVACQTVLILHYVQLESWKDVATAMFYNLRTVYKIRDRALEELDAMIANGKIVTGHSRALEGNPDI